ncbi:MAG: SurA N-terminal domain-containing protein [Dehalococcoidales bacterium]
MASKNKAEKHPREMTHRALSHHKKQVRRQRFILFGGIAVLLAVALIIMAGWYAGEYVPMHKTVLQVHDTKFSTGYFIDRLELGLRTNTDSTKTVDDITSSVIDQIIQAELAKQSAAALGVTVSDNAVEELLNSVGFPLNKANRDAAYAQLVTQKMITDYFDTLVPVSDNQVDLKAIMVEDYATGLTVREKMMNGDNITALAEEYAQGYFSTTYKGDFGFHSLPYFQNQQIPSVPVDYAFGDGITAGTVSQPLTDNTSYKQMGYWVIKINDRPTDVSANVSAIFCTDKVVAASVRDKLAAGDNVTALAEEFSQYAKVPNGAIGIVNASDNVSGSATFVSQEFYDYVFNADTPVGEWSGPVLDTTNWTQGAYWVVLVADRQDNSALSDDDRQSLVDAAYYEWSSGLMAESAADVFNNFTTDLKAWAVDKAVSKVQ